MREAYDELLSANPGFSSDFMLGPHLETTGAQGVRGSRRWLSFVTRPELLDMVEQLIGEDIILWGTTIFGKPAHGGKATPWHQDGAYYPIRPLETLSIWIALDDAVPDNGCMRFIPGSHKDRKIFSHHWEEDQELTINRVCDSEHFDEASARDLVLAAGQISFHDVYIIHSSRANPSGRRRAALVGRFMPGHCHYDHELGQINSFAIEDTPIGVLVQETIRFDELVEVTEVSRDPGVIRVTLVDAEDPAMGSLTLVFVDAPLELRQWQVKDAQGLVTTVAFLDGTLNPPLDPALFVFDDPRSKLKPGKVGN